MRTTATPQAGQHAKVVNQTDPNSWVNGLVVTILYQRFDGHWECIDNYNRRLAFPIEHLVRIEPKTVWEEVPWDV